MRCDLCQIPVWDEYNALDLVQGGELILCLDCDLTREGIEDYDLVGEDY